MQTGTVTLLFTDLVASTELMSARGEDAADELRQRLFGVLREAVVECKGEEVKNLGDGLMVAFASAVDGALCAVLMQQSVVRFNRRMRDDLRIRVGLSVGEAACEDGDYFGAPVVEASRLCDAAEGGQILAGDLVRLLVGSRGGLTFRHVGDLDLKGLPEPVPACEVAWQEVGGERVELPPEFGVPGQVPFVGRTAERLALVDAWKRAIIGEQRAVFVSGEPGIGKTRLVAELAVDAYDQGATVLYGRCDEEMLVPYQPFVESLRRYVAVCPVDDLQRHVAVNGTDLARLVPELARRLPDAPLPARAEPDTERYRLFESVVSLLADAGEAAPVLLVLDDLHWADRSTILLLRHLLRTPAAHSLLVVGTYRGSELDRSSALVGMFADLRREDAAERITLRGLDEDSLVEMMERSAGQKLGPRGRELAAVLHRETEGSPFFAAEILRHLTEVGAIVQKDGRWTYDVTAAGLGIPEGVREVIGRRLTRLSEDAARMLGVAALIGRTFDLDLLEELTDRSEDELVEILEEALARNVVVEHRHVVDRYEFSHALVRTALYDGLSVSRRVRLHRRLGEILETPRHGETPRLAELAYHFFAAAPAGDLDKAVDYARRAGDEALAQVAYGEAARHYERALQAAEMASDDQAPRLELLLALGDALNRAGEVEAGKEAFLAAAEAARELASAEGLTQAGLGYGGSHYDSWNDLDDTTAIALLTEALEKLGDGESHLRALALARLAAWSVFASTFEERLALTDEALSLARASGDPETLAEVLTDRHLALSAPARVEERAAEAAELVTLGESLDDKDAVAWGLHFRFRYLLVAGDLQGADAVAARYSATAEQLRRPDHLWRADCYDIIRAVMRGEIDLADRRAHEVLDRSEVAGSRATIVFAGQLVMVRWLQGRLDEIVPAVERLQAEQALPIWHHVLSFAYARCGRLDDARREFEAAAGSGFDTVPLDAAWMSSLWTLSDACAALGDAERAAALYEILLPYRDLMFSNGLAYFCGAVADALGRLAAITGRLDDAEEHFRAAVETLDRLDAPPFAAISRLAYGAMLARSGDPERVGRARPVLEDAIEGARRGGVAFVEAEAREVLATLG